MTGPGPSAADQSGPAGQHGFGARLRAAVTERGPLCVGIDPHPALLSAWDLPDDTGGLERFCLAAVEALADRVAVLKPQSAFFERHGARGVAVLEDVVRTARAAGALVLMDAKRGDIASTTEAYAQAYLHPGSPLGCDAVTASPYLGVGALDPLVATASRHGGGVFVLALTSNPEGAAVQRARSATGRTVAGDVLHAVARHNAGALPLGSVGAVVGATAGSHGEDLAVNGPLLAPGVGAQEATTADLRAVFGEQTANVLPAVAREVLRAGPSPVGLRAAAARVLDECVARLA